MVKKISMMTYCNIGLFVPGELPMCGGGRGPSNSASWTNEEDMERSAADSRTRPALPCHWSYSCEFM